MKSFLKSLTCFLVILSLFGTKKIFSQNDSLSGIKYIEKLIEADSLLKAKNKLDKEISLYRSQKNYQKLTTYIPLVGSFKLANADYKMAIANAELFVNEIKQFDDALITIDALIQLSNLYFDARLHDKNYKTCTEALIIIGKTEGVAAHKVSDIEYNLGTVLLNLGNNENAKEHLYKSKKILESTKNNKLQRLYNTYNSIGRIQSNITQIDSSTFYYSKALEILDKMDSTETNRNYWRAIVNNNISLNFQNIGDTDEAIQYISNAIFDFQKFINVTKDESKKLRARRYRLTTIDNLATFYEGIGEFNSALDLLTYSYQEKQKFLKDDDANILFSLVLLGQSYLNTKHYKIAAKYTDKALAVIEENPDTHSYLHSFTLMLRASIYEEMNDLEGAKTLYLDSEILYNKAFKGNYSKDHLDALIEMSKFYAKKNEAEKAMELALKGYNFTKRKQFENDLIHFHHTVNLSSVFLILKKDREALKYSEEALDFFNREDSNEKTLMNIVQNEYRKPRALLVNAKAKYQLEEIKSEAFLTALLAQIEEGIAILERRKIIIKTFNDLNLLIEENNDLFSFAKQIRLDLYKKTKKDIYLQDLISIHESSLYNRIRSRLNIKNNIAFTNIPTVVTQREKKLKKDLKSALNTAQNTMEVYFEVTNNWNQFLDSLKITHPKYYKMRYATITESLDSIQNNIPKNTTVVRYLFIEDNLYAFIVDANNQNLVPLEFKSVKNYIKELNENQFTVQDVSHKLLKLYNKLWEPISNMIINKNIIIIPDGELFNLSFETLTPIKINSFKELANNSLLANYNISYNYSLFLINNQKKIIDYDNNFIAFVPEFTDKMKKNYTVEISDSLNMDKTYLTLLPQPFSKDIVKKYTRIFNGSSFVNDEASKQIFTNKAKEHKIIHIGTHAESNNVNPELSRLVFAKNVSNRSNLNDNYLYTYEIYNQNLNSNLAILTACETGKPSYQAGEGMISLAHAFNYAGSESILTSLWKIDEQSSAQIIESFYDYLSDGLSKNEALRQAKLDYIAHSDGRTTAPQYWAGLVLLGDVSPLKIVTNSSYPYIYIFLAIFLTGLFIYIRYLKKSSNSATI